MMNETLPKDEYEGGDFLLFSELSTHGVECGRLTHEETRHFCSAVSV